MRYHGWTVGVMHEVLDPVEMPHWPIERTMQHSFGCRTDIIVCGHTHVEDIQRYGDVWVINPGSPTYPRNLQAQLWTVGILGLEEGHRADVAAMIARPCSPTWPS